ncbi:hypothetical protein FV139_04130 [Parahaliea maris]|uniref:Uncharacterized protein n=1 Tax=Parahaliea maris TaxID=2716870 RepID=A0A5C9AAP4_9GAMM|nr:hypothetical protein [Parahaliea maris]TXS96667.1 hypothetical protein FV139_04130 [Parahaliea maris]
MRQLTALLVAGSGVWQVATLWLGPLTQGGLLTALTGGVYLLMSVGLSGQSRFSLFVAIVLPAAHLWFSYGLDNSASASTLAAIDAIVILLSTRVLWALRHQPSL